MSWQPYVDQLTSSGAIKSAALIGVAGGVWATSPGFNLTAAEISALVGGFSNPSAIQASGFSLSGSKYMTIRADDQLLIGKKGGGGVSISKGKQAIIIGTYEEGTQPGTANSTVEKLADYLRGIGY